MIELIGSIINEYGVKWIIDRALYSIKLKAMSIAPITEEFYEETPNYPSRLDIFTIDTDALRSFLQERLSDDDKSNLIELADNACNGIIKGFSFVNIDYGNPIDWQLNPLTHVRCSENTKWYNISDFDEKRGDIKVVWEASRFSHFITFARAYLLTEDVKYYEAFHNQLMDWLIHNTYSNGANYKCGQECSIRMVNVLLAYTVFRGCGVATDEDASNVRDLIDRCYRKVLSNFFYAYRCIKNNHTISEIMGMIVGAYCCCDDAQLKKAYGLLDEVIDEQFTSDGGYRQFSFNYTRLALQDIEVVLSISDKTGNMLNTNSINKVGNAAMLMYQCQDESYDMPNYGSNDGALIFPTTSCEYRDFRPVINTITALIDDYQLYPDDIHTEELIWFAGSKTISAYVQQDVKRVSKSFVDAGLFTIRGCNSWAMIIDNKYETRPGHMDQLHFDLWIDGKNVFCDAGSYSYVSDIGRELTRNISHNTALLESVDQMNAYSHFMVLNWTGRRIIKSDDTTFDGVMYSRNGYTHRRRVKYIGSRYVISDKVSRDAYILFHTPYEVEQLSNEIIISNKGTVLCRLRATKKFDIKTFNSKYVGSQGSVRSIHYLEYENITTIAIQLNINEVLKTVIKIEGE